MGANEEPRKIQDVIDSINREWGEEHENDQKYIFRRNIISIPLYSFLFISFIYIFPVLLYIIAGKLIKENNFEVPREPFFEIYFNFPYYVFDLRVGVIASIASLLLSLYVSVGKYADGLGGVANDARRAVYRRFARWVGRIIFCVFSLNFWHGLLAGYFRKDYYPAPNFLPMECPEWCTNLVQKDMDLHRYGEMPLWTLLFFAWFTLASSLMLTYSAKDSLIKNLSALRRINRLRDGNGKPASNEYILAQAAFNSDKNIRVSEGDKYGSPFLSTYDYVRFKVDLNALELIDIKGFGSVVHEIKPVKQCGIWWFRVLALLGFFPAAWAYYNILLNGNLNAIVLISSLGVLAHAMWLINASRLIPYWSILKIGRGRLSRWERIYEFGRVLCIDIWNWVLFCVVGFLPVMATYYYIGYVWVGVDYVRSNNWHLCGILYYIYMCCVLPIMYMVLVKKPKLEYEVRRYSRVSLKSLISRMNEKTPGEVEGLNYMAVAYIYCLMRDVEELYSEYEIEVGMAKRNHLEDKGMKSYYPMYPLNIKCKDSN